MNTVRTKLKWPLWGGMVLALTLMAGCSSGTGGTAAPAVTSAQSAALSQSATAMPTPSPTMRPPTPTPSPPSSTASASSAPDAALPADLAPDSAGPTGHCLVGTKPWNIEFYGADAANTCAKYSNEFADMGFPNQPVHAYAPPGDPNFVELRPSGASIGCGLQWPLDINRLQATVFGYNGGDITSDAGPIAKAICARMIGLGWQH